MASDFSQPRPNVKTAPYKLANSLPIFPFAEGQRRAFDQYRIIRTKILQHLRQPKLVAVTSASPQDGKTITSLNVAAVMALKENVQVVLVEADLHRGNISNSLGLPKGPGLSEYLRGKCTIEEAMVRVEQIPNLYIVRAGAADAGASELLDSSVWRNLCKWLREEFSHAVLDCPPLGVLADGELIMAESDGVVFVVRPDHTNKTLALATLDSIPKDKLLGVVLNSAQDWFLHRSEYSYYYQGYYSRDPATEASPEA
jgi:capsular exopolysaccharide synthesis family protein